jgi:hypothetical protein
MTCGVQRDDMIADLDASDTFTDRLYDASTLVTKNAREQTLMNKSAHMSTEIIEY